MSDPSSNPDGHGAPPVMEVSVIVPAKNAIRSIDACLGALTAHLSTTSCEIIVVDNGSSDGTVERVLSRSVRVLPVPSGFVSRVRNEGARAARGKIVAFVDADCTVLPEWLDAVKAVLADPKVGIAGCRHDIPADSTWCQRVWHEAQVRREAALAGVAYVPAGNCAIRRDLFLDLGGFDERLETGEDPDLCVRIAQQGYVIASCKAMRNVHLGEPPTLAAIFRRERWHGRGARFVYAGGKLAPVTVATALFSMLLVVGTVAMVSRFLHASNWLLLAIPMAFLVPFMFAVRYGSPTRPWQFMQLWSIYSAYFLGRAASLPVVLRRSLRAI